MGESIFLNSEYDSCSEISGYQIATIILGIMFGLSLLILLVIFIWILYKDMNICEKEKKRK